jgi:two-component system, chemotaxis family, CheB/CheR fusion protein
MNDRTSRKREPADADDLASLLEYLKSNRGFDFSGYKRSSLERRFQKRMDAVGVTTYGEYEDYLQVHPDEFKDLFDTILINVTGFFRDSAAWDFLAEDVIPQLTATAREQPIRVWSAACASGEEAYSVAMLLAEALGEDQLQQRVKIYATDVDEDALSIARHAVFTRDQIKGVPRELLEKYFEPHPTGHIFRSDLRRSVIFGRNDLVQDAPISRVDLLISRNALMYFTPETQARILEHFNFSLRETGYLFLGKSEMLITHGDLFTPYNLKWRVFTKVPRAALRDRLQTVPPLRFGQEAVERYSMLRDGAADVLSVAQIVIDRSGFLAAANHAARSLFGIGVADVGRPLQDLEISYRPVELRAALEQAHELRRTITLGRATWGTGDEERTFEIEVVPLFSTSAEHDTLGASVTFTDVTQFARLDDQHRTVERELETAYEELQSTVEELETTNEELQSTNEELETTNEELQSTNEELETMNEELQSTNDELEAMNDEQRERASELDRLNLFLEGILGNLGVGVVVVDLEQRVQLWNGSATDLWGLREPEVRGEPFLSLDIGFPVESLKSPIRKALSDGAQPTEMVREAVNRRGKAFRCMVRVLPLFDTGGRHFGAILLMSDADAETDGAADDS